MCNYSFTQHIEIRQNFLGDKFYIKRTRLDNANTLDVLKVNPDASKMYKKAMVRTRLGSVLAASGGVLCLYPESFEVAKVNSRLIGSVLIGGGLTIIYLNNQKKSKAVELYNISNASKDIMYLPRNYKTQFNLKSTGPNLSVSF